MSTQQAQSATAARNNLVMISVNISMFGGYKRTTAQDIIAAGGKLPKSEILTKGGKHIFPVDKLAPFNRIKKRVISGLWDFGVKSFDSGNVIAIIDDDLESAEKLLDDAKVEFYSELANLRANYDTYLTAFINAQPDQATKDIINESKLEADDACGRFGFNYDTFMHTPVGKNGSLESMASRLVIKLYDEVAKEAEKAYDQSYAPMDSSGVRHIRRVGQRAKSPLKACREKLDKWRSFSNVAGAVEIIDHVLATTQQAGWVDDTPSNPCAQRLLGLVILMTDAENFAAASAKVLCSNKRAEVIDKLCGVAQSSDLLNEAVAPQPSVTTPVVSEVVETAASERNEVEEEEVALPLAVMIPQRPATPVHRQFF